MPELAIEVECTFKSKKSKKFALNIIELCTEKNDALECLIGVPGFGVPGSASRGRRPGVGPRELIDMKRIIVNSAL